METLPVELHSLIFAYACASDAGYTARALSSVCLSFSNIAHPFLYFSLAVEGPKHVSCLKKKLESIPANKRVVRHLYLSASTACVSENAGSEDFDGEETLRNISRILQLTSMTLHTLSLSLISPLVFPRSASVIGKLFRMNWPELKELSIAGFYPFPSWSFPLPSSTTLSPTVPLRESLFSPSPSPPVSHSTSPPFPKLTHLHLSHNRNPNGLLSTSSLASACPQLTHLRVSGLSMALSFVLEAEGAIANVNVKTNNDDASEECDGESLEELFPAHLPPYLTHFFVQPGPAPLILGKQAIRWMKDEQMMTRLKALQANSAMDEAESEGGVKRGLLVQVLERNVVSDKIMKDDWVDRLTGGGGSWSR